MEAQNVSVQQMESQNSYEFGPTGNRFKFYFWTIEQLKTKIKEAVLCGLIENSPLKE